MKIRAILRVMPLIVVLIVYFNPGRHAISDEVGQEEKTERMHTIKKGDTLWDISAEYLKNPFLWPNIWEINKYIKNPDLIYPGHKLIIMPYVVPAAPVTGAVEAPLTATEATVSAPSPAVPPPQETTLAIPAPSSPPSPPLPEELEESIVQPPAPSVIGADLIYAGGYITDSIESSGIISGSSDERNIFANGDNVNILLHSNASDVSVGDRFTIFKTPTYVVHPESRKKVGMLLIPVGVLEINRVQGKDAAGIIIKSYTYSSPGDHIQPYRPASPVSEATQTPLNLHGYIVESNEGKILDAEYDIVYLDRGASDGVTPGTIFYVIGEDHNDPIGELKVISVQATTSTAIVKKSMEPFSIGSKIVTTAVK